MGVEGLLRVLKEILDERQVGYITNLYAQARGKRLAIDGHGFLHRLVVIPKFAHALLFNEDCSRSAHHCLQSGITSAIAFLSRMVATSLRYVTKGLHHGPRRKHPFIAGW